MVDAAHARHPAGFVQRWLTPTNHKDIGTPYLFTAAVGLIAVLLSV